MRDTNLPQEDDSAPRTLIERLQYKWMGRRHVNEQYVQVVYRDRKYARVAGPDYFTINAQETLGPKIYLGFRFGKLQYTNLATREPVPVGLKIDISFVFDPRLIGSDDPDNTERSRGMAASLVKLPDAAFPRIIEGAALPHLRRLIAVCSVTDIQLGTVFDVMEKEVKQKLDADPTLKRLGVVPKGFQIVDSILPDEIRSGFVSSAESEIIRRDVQSAGGAEMSLVTVIKFLENLPQPGGDTLVATGDVVSTLRGLVDAMDVSSRYVDIPPTSTEPPPAVPPSTAPPAAPPGILSAAPSEMTVTFSPMVEPDRRQPRTPDDKPDDESYVDF